MLIKLSHKLIVECNNYYGTPSEERCTTIADYVKQQLGNNCVVNMQEQELAENLIKPQIIVKYEDGEHEILIRKLDSIMLQIGLTAIKAIIGRVVTHAVEGAVAGGLAGLGLGSSSKKGEVTLVSALLLALLGGVVGNLIENLEVELVASKQSGAWTFKRVIYSQSSAKV